MDEWDDLPWWKQQLYFDGLLEEFTNRDGQQAQGQPAFAEDEGAPVQQQLPSRRGNLWDDPDEDEDIGDGVLFGGEARVQVYEVG
jgi:hypothetical protein